ncbi:MAG: prepilin-type N-terminal cleavage/methylation domain-containing protein [Patescibacteria group bacterium]|nr:prepilin-type N-terminal cleavage/methylation domain-containing protein [Patescibacteria group bacterium]MCL5224379.1 prepilin-type N-terminal cleavage/methylation domain-containing protein [Patescibacteria group bacterium]
MSLVPKDKRGFTLIELLLYVAIFAISAGIITSVMVNALRIQGGENSSTEVSSQLNYVLATVQRLVQQSSEIEYAYEGTSTSTPCTTFCTLELRNASSTLDPTWITSNANGVYVQQGGGTQGGGTVTAITNSLITVNNLKFTIYTFPGGNTTVQVNGSFAYNTSNSELAVTKTLESAIGRVSAATFDSAILPTVDNSLSIGQGGSSNLRWQNIYLGGTLYLSTSSLLGLGTNSTDTSGLSSPGFLYYNTASNTLRVFNGTTWSNVSPFVVSGTSTYFTGGNVGINTSTPASTLDVNGSLYSELYAPTYSSSMTIDWSKGNTQKIVLTGNATLTFTNGQPGGKYSLMLVQDSTGGRTITWPSNVKWSGGTAPTLTTTANKTDFVGFIFGGSNYYGVGTVLNF